MEWSLDPIGLGSVLCLAILAGATAKTIALIVPSIQHLSFANLAQGVQDTIEKRNYSLFIVSSNNNSARERLLCENLSYQWIDGVLFANWNCLYILLITIDIFQLCNCRCSKKAAKFAAFFNHYSFR